MSPRNSGTTGHYGRLRAHRPTLHADAEREPLVNPVVDDRSLRDALLSCCEQTWVCVDDGVVTGHLYGAVLDSALHGSGAWVGPDGASFDDVDDLESLYSVAGASWIELGASDHYVWTFDDVHDTNPWFEMGFARMHRRGVLTLGERVVTPIPPGYSVRRGDVRDIDALVSLDDELDIAQEHGPSFLMSSPTETKRADLLELVDDPDVHYYLVEYGGAAVAQCCTFALATQRGSFDSSVHVSAVSVRPSHRGRGVGRAMVDRALDDARVQGFTHAETNWRVTNRDAQRFWLRYGFRPTYVRLHRTVGPT